MTLPLRRNHRITAPSTRRPTRRAKWLASALAAACAFGGPLAVATTPARSQQPEVRLEAPVVNSPFVNSPSLDSPASNGWQGRSEGLSPKVVRPAPSSPRLPNSGPAIRVISSTAPTGAAVRWKVRDANPSYGVVNRDPQVQAASETQPHDARRDPFGDQSRFTAAQDAVAPDSQAPNLAPPAESAPAVGGPELGQPALDPPAPMPRRFGAPPEQNIVPQADEPMNEEAAPPPRTLGEPLRTIPMGPPNTIPPKALPAVPPRQFNPAETEATPAPAPGPSTRPPAAPKSSSARRSNDGDPGVADAAELGDDENLETPLRNAAFCRRLYNERNCCSDENACNEHRAYVKSHPLSKISLDITPTCNLTSRENSGQGQCGFPFEQSPARVWRDRKGQEVARGRVTAMANLRVEVTDDDGKATRIRVRDLGEDDICFLAAWCGVPSECRLDDVALAARNWTPITMTWKASGLCHKPLYFEEEQLERYGHTTGPLFQPFLSGAHFFSNIALLPYNMGIHPLNECQYSLGYYRPGSCAPWMIPPFPLSARGALAEAGVVLGGIYIIP